MKLKSILYLIIFMPITTIESKGGKAAANKPEPRPARPRQEQQKPAPGRQQQAQETYTSLLQYIRKAPSGNIFKDGEFTPDFLGKTQRIKPTDLIAVEALLQAARNLHMPLSGDDEENSHLITQTNAMISDLKNKWFPVNLELSPEQIAANDIILKHGKKAFLAYHEGTKTSFFHVAKLLVAKMPELRKAAPDQVSQMLLDAIETQLNKRYTAEQTASLKEHINNHWNDLLEQVPAQ